MAIINCPECRKEVSDRAKQCPQCGCPVNPEGIEKRVINVNSAGKTEANVNSTVVVEPKEGCFLQTLNAGCMIIAVIVVVIVLLVALRMCHSVL